MENKAASNGTGGKVAIIGAIITAIAGIITTIVSISGPIMDKRLAIEATQTREAFIVETTRVAGAAVQKADQPTPQPAFTSAAANAAGAVSAAVDTAATAGAAATPTPQSASTQPPAEKMLRVGEKWVIGNGITVQLTDIEYPNGNEIHLHFTFYNTSNKVINVAVDHNRDVTLTDDKGNVYKWATDFTWEVSIAPGTDRKDEIKRRGNVAKASHFIIKLDLPEIGSAQWQE